MKRCTLKANRDIRYNGITIVAGTVLAVVESDMDWGTLFSCVTMGTISEAPASSESSPSNEEVQSVPPPSVVEPVAPVVDVHPEDGQPSEFEPAGKLLVDAGMSEGLAARLNSNGILTVEQLAKYVADGKDLAELENVSRAYAKQIRAWLVARQ